MCIHVATKPGQTSGELYTWNILKKNTSVPLFASTFTPCFNCYHGSKCGFYDFEGKFTKLTSFKTVYYALLWSHIENVTASNIK